jgi:hypothetical protein
VTSPTKQARTGVWHLAARSRYFLFPWAAPEAPPEKRRGRPFKPWRLREGHEYNVHPSGCWIWSGLINTSGYGKIWYRKKTWTAHRLTYTMEVGPVPDGMYVCHSCDTPLCVNPEHLWLGTAQDNYDDMRSKGRAGKARGESAGQAKLTEDQAIEIIAHFSDPDRVKRGDYMRFAERFNVSDSTIRAVQRGKTWGHLQNA